MIHPGDDGTATVRATFLIDPAGIVRLSSYYPASNGRNVEETLRMLAALQETDATGLSTPAGWQPGDPGVTPPPVSIDEADRTAAAGAGTWYYQPDGAASAGRRP
jgi:peroxiredoxin (alkyl hydroperoxide reductase subunit C)